MSTNSEDLTTRTVVAELRLEVLNLKNAVRDKDAENVELRKRVQMLTDANAGVEDSLNKRVLEIMELERQCSSDQNAAITLQGRLDAMSKRVLGLENERGDLENVNVILTEKLKDFTSMQQEKSQTMEKIKKLESDVSHWMMSHTELQTGFSALEKINADLNSKLTVTQASIKESAVWEAKIKQLNDDLNKAKEIFVQSDAELTRSLEGLEKQKLSICELTSELNKKDLVIAELKESHKRDIIELERKHATELEEGENNYGLLLDAHRKYAVQKEAGLEEKISTLSKTYTDIQLETLFWEKKVSEDTINMHLAKIKELKTDLGASVFAIDAKKKDMEHLVTNYTDACNLSVRVAMETFEMAKKQVYGRTVALAEKALKLAKKLTKHNKPDINFEEETINHEITLMIQRLSDTYYSKSEILKLKVGDTLDILDGSQYWYASKIISITPHDNYLCFRVHFIGWDKKYDEDIYSSYNKRFAPFGTHTNGIIHDEVVKNPKCKCNVCVSKDPYISTLLRA